LTCPLLLVRGVAPGKKNFGTVQGGCTISWWQNDTKKSSYWCQNATISIALAGDNTGQNGQHLP
jgi:hypothetical protein